MNPFQAIRELTMYKIKINNAREWDIANYEDLVNLGADEYNPQERKG